MFVEKCETHNTNADKALYGFDKEHPKIFEILRRAPFGGKGERRDILKLKMNPTEIKENDNSIRALTDDFLLIFINLLSIIINLLSIIMNLL